MLMGQYLMCIKEAKSCPVWLAYIVLDIVTA